MQEASPLTISFILPGSGVTAITLSNKMVMTLAGILCAGVLLIGGMLAAVLAGIGYVVVQVALLGLHLLAIVALSPVFIGLLVPALFIFVCVLLIGFCGRYLWGSLFPRRAVD